MEAILNAGIPAEVAAVISNDPAAAGLATAASHGARTAVVDHRRFADRTAFDNALAATIDDFHPDLVVLAGFMRILGDAFVVRYSGRTLLHAAAAAGDQGTLELLLRLGALPGTPDDGGHTALYCVANECRARGGPDVVRALVRAGADVNACDGVKRSTALHMAARRGREEVAAALLECGASLEAPDSMGDTPLRRAVNCNQTGVASFLAARGADLNSRGSKGLTPKSAARTEAMRRALGI
jgi:ankyrin repeat protein